MAHWSAKLNLRAALISREWRRSPLAIALLGMIGVWGAIALQPFPSAQAQTGNQGTITLKADVQEANAITGVITARGNVQIDYPTRDITATSAQAQYFSEENRMILSGDVVVLQEGNRLEAETVTYLIDEGRFIALPQPNNQVETTYLVTDDPADASTSTSATEDNETAAGGNVAAPPDGTLSISPLGE